MDTIAIMPREPMSHVNKSAWIRQQPFNLTAKELIDKAQREGFTLSVQQIYSVRHEARKAAAAGSISSASKATTSTPTNTESKPWKSVSSETNGAKLRYVTAADLKSPRSLGRVSCRRHSCTRAKSSQRVPIGRPTSCEPGTRRPSRPA